MSKRIIAVFTGNRAEYGLQYPILKAIDAHPDLDYRLIVSGAHLDKQFGRTLAEIEADGFKVHAEVKIDLQSDTLYATAQAIGSGVMSMGHALSEIRPDMLVVYADRFEGFAAVIAGTQMNVPTAHVEGGDLTEGGALDDRPQHVLLRGDVCVQAGALDVERPGDVAHARPGIAMLTEERAGDVLDLSPA